MFHDFRLDERLQDNSHGFNLLEMLIVLSLISIFSVSFLLGWQRWLQDHRLVAQMNVLKQMIAFARTSAMHGGQPVILCGSQDFQHCDGRWSSGWLVMSQSNQKILRQHRVSLQKLQVGWRGALGKSELIFQPSGSVLGAPGSFSGYLLNTKDDVYQATVSASGRWRRILRSF